MTRTWTLLGLPALLALALAAPNRLAAEEGLKTDSQKLDAALKKLTDIEKSLGELEKIRKEINDLRLDTNLIVQKAREDINGMKGHIAQLRKDLDELRGRVAGTTRTALYPPEAKGRVVLVNESGFEAEIVLNDRTYRLVPNMSREVELPAGTFTFRVPNRPGFETTQNRVLLPNYHYRITIHP